MEHTQLHSNTCVFTALKARSAYTQTVHTALSYTYTSIQPVGNPMGRLTNSLELLTMEKKTGVINANLISNNKCVCGGGGGGRAKREG